MGVEGKNIRYSKTPSLLPFHPTPGETILESRFRHVIYLCLAFSQPNIALAQNISYSWAMFWELHFLIQEICLLRSVLLPHEAVIRR